MARSLCDSGSIAHSHAPIIRKSRGKTTSATRATTSLRSRQRPLGLQVLVEPHAVPSTSQQHCCKPPWADSLITSERTPRTVRDVWIVAARTVFGWAKHRKLIAGNPFTDVKVSVPRSQGKRETKAFRKDEFTTILKAAASVSDTTRAGASARRWVP